MFVARRIWLSASVLAVASLVACGQSDTRDEFTQQPDPPAESTSAAVATQTPLSTASQVQTPAPSTVPDQAPDGELTVAPDFTLPSANGSPITLSKLTAEQPVVLVFYRAFW